MKLFHRPLSSSLGDSNGAVLLLSIALLASTVCLMNILDYPELPSLPSSGISSIFSGLTWTMSSAGLAGLFVLMFLESFSLPIPSELFLPLAGYLVFLGKMSFLGAVLVSTGAGFAGNAAAYYLALLLGRPAMYGVAKKIGIGRDAIEKSEKWLNGSGSFAVFMSRFIPGFRSSISFPAGTLRMSFTRFSIMTILGCFGWSAILIYVGYSAGPLWQSSSSAFYSELISVVQYLVIAASASYTIYFLYRRKKLRRLWS